MVTMLFRAHPQLSEEQCHLDWQLRDRRLLYEVKYSPGGVRVTFGKAIYAHADAVERAYLAALRFRRELTSAVREQMFVDEEKDDRASY
jgi:hypothetical protein